MPHPDKATTVAPKGIKGSDLSDDQKAMLLALIPTRLGFINADDYAAKMEVVRAELDHTWFGWLGAAGCAGLCLLPHHRAIDGHWVRPQDTQSATPEQEHAHSMFRNPANDYGAAWIGTDQ